MAGPGTIPAKRIRFGVYTVDLSAGELTKYGTRVRLQDHPLRILVSLLRDPGAVVSREELRQQLWPNGTFVDFDHGISSAVNKLRAALGDTAANPKFIETVGRRGYRFIYPATEMVSEINPSVPMETVVPGSFSLRNHKRWIAAVIVGLAIAVVTTLYLSRNAPMQIRSVAVLPLKNLSNSADEEFFSEGLTEELTTKLASLPGLRVIARSSVMRYKDTRMTVPEIARELHVDALVEGSVLRVGERVRITVQLIDASSQRYLWAESYEREQKDIIDLQNEVTRRVAEKIRLSLNPDDRDRLKRPQAIDPQAHDDYLRGRSYLNRRTIEDLSMAAQYFQRASDRDPEFAQAYAGLADAYALAAAYSLDPPQQNIEKARSAALKALELDNRLAEAHTSLALIYQNYDWNWTEAEKEYRKAIALNPSYATAHHWYAEFLAFMGRFDESQSEFARARQLDPFSLIIRADNAVCLYYARQYDASIQEFQAVQAIDPNFPRGHIIADVYAQQGKYEEAIAAAKNTLPRNSIWVVSRLATYSAKSGNRKASLKLLHSLEKKYRGKNMNPGPLLGPYLALGKKDKVLAALQQSYEEHYTVIDWLKVDPAFDPLRQDPEFRALLQRVRLGQ